MAWRGPVVARAPSSQFWGETNWGDIDYLFVDMPPGTSDVLLTVFQSLPVDGIVTVSAPQELVAMIVGKAVNLAHNMDVERDRPGGEHGLLRVRRMRQEAHYIFGDPQGCGGGQALPDPGLRHVAAWTPAFARLCDEGHVEKYDAEEELDPIVVAIETHVTATGAKAE